MKNKFTLYLLFCFTLFSFNINAQAPDWSWVKPVGDVSDHTATATDSAGNLYITGHFFFTATFDTITLQNRGWGLSMYIAKYDQNQKLLWVRQADDGASGTAVAVDNSGNVFVTGYFWNTADFKDTTVTSKGYEDVFVVKYSSSGNLLWVRTAGGKGIYDPGPRTYFDDVAYGVATDAQGNVYVTGSCMDSAYFGSTLFREGGFLAKYDSSGAFQWAKKNDGIFGIRADRSGDVITTGYATSRFDPNGNISWRRQEGKAGHVLFRGIALDAAGNAYVTGDKISTAADTLVFSNGDTIRGQAAVTAKYNPAGSLLWVKPMRNQSTGFVSHRSIASDSRGNTFITGQFSDMLATSSGTFKSNGGSDIHVASHDSSGTLLWVKTVGGHDFDGSKFISIAPNGDLFLTGKVSSAWFGSHYFTANYNNFLAKLSYSVVGFAEGKPEEEILLYPNPARSTVYLKLPESWETAHVTIMQLNGRTMAK